MFGYRGRNSAQLMCLFLIIAQLLVVNLHFKEPYFGEEYGDSFTKTYYTNSISLWLKFHSSNSINYVANYLACHFLKFIKNSPFKYKYCKLICIDFL